MWGLPHRPRAVKGLERLQPCGCPRLARLPCIRAPLGRLAMLRKRDHADEVLACARAAAAAAAAAACTWVSTCRRPRHLGRSVLSRWLLPPRRRAPGGPNPSGTSRRGGAAVRRS